MQHVQAKAAPGRYSKRAMGLLFAGLLQAGFVWALVAGLDIKLGTIVTDPFKVSLEHEPTKPRTPPPAGPQIELKEIVVPEPVLNVDNGDDRPTAPTGVAGDLHPTPPAGPADHGPLSVATTHTIPPYPAMDIRLGNEGTVLLRLTVGPDGRVIAAQVVRSSGSESLDRAAQNWVIGRWRYQPAVRGGVAVPSAVDVAVKFSLKTAG
jgi:periplasmic protein TonB